MQFEKGNAKPSYKFKIYCDTQGLNGISNQNIEGTNTYDQSSQSNEITDSIVNNLDSLDVSSNMYSLQSEFRQSQSISLFQTY